MKGSSTEHTGDTGKISRVTIPLYGLSFGGDDTPAVEQALYRVAGVRNAYASPATEMAYVEYDPDRCCPERLVEAIDSTGLRAGTPVNR